MTKGGNKHIANESFITEIKDIITRQDKRPIQPSTQP